MEEDVPEGVVNLLEMIVRCFDCWLSCAAHITVVKEDGEEIYSRMLNVGLGWLTSKKMRLVMTWPSKVKANKYNKWIVMKKRKKCEKNDSKFRISKTDNGLSRAWCIEVLFPM